MGSILGDEQSHAKARSRKEDGVSVSIVIPTWNEAPHIARTIRELRLQKPHEIIVVDGGSGDDTVRQAVTADRVLISEPGRALQMNAGAAAASGDFLLFLHADCRLEAGAVQAIERALARPGIFAGCFAMCVETAGLGFRSIDACATARVRFTGVVYGDQGLFLRRDDFRRLGGFPPIRFMEDVFFSRRLATRGRIVVVNKKIYVSPRRWQKVGLLRQTLRNWTLTALALAGVSPDRLALYYPRVR
jgi:rSAM/selenodomain-associated transferase 2